MNNTYLAIISIITALQKYLLTQIGDFWFLHILALSLISVTGIMFVGSYRGKIFSMLDVFITFIVVLTFTVFIKLFVIEPLLELLSLLPILLQLCFDNKLPMGVGGSINLLMNDPGNRGLDNPGNDVPGIGPNG